MVPVAVVAVATTVAAPVEETGVLAEAEALHILVAFLAEPI
jgi:hypothetical protein